MIAPNLYLPVYLIVVTVICFLLGTRFIASTGYEVQEKGNYNIVLPLILCVVCAYFFGARPYSHLFGDTTSYMRIYSLVTPFSTVDIDWRSEWLWQTLMVTCKSLGLTVNSFFTIVAIVYLFTSFLAVRALMPNNVMLGMAFVLSSLMFYTFGINGIRNGLACHLTLWAMTLVLRGNYPVGIAIMAAAFGIHRSVMLPIASFVAAMFLIKDVKWAIAGWVASIFLSLFMGGWFTNFFAGLGFDDRMASYTASTDYSEFSRSGFRWDFLLYSAMPVLMVWYVFVKKEVYDSWYRVLAVTYCLANSFWILVIRATFSNRFAYLSWFMYPLIIAYPLIMLPVWEDQDQMTAYILYAYVGFTFVMNILWHAF